MNEGMIVDVARDALKVVLMVSAPLLGISLVVGLAVSVFQATTQIQEQTLTFIPKLVAIIVSIIFFGAWMLATLVEYTQRLYGSMNNFVK